MILYVSFVRQWHSYVHYFKTLAESCTRTTVYIVEMKADEFC